MWFGKLAIILYFFSGVLLFVGYMMEQGIGTTLFTGATQAQLDELTSKNNIDIEANPTLIFGDFIAGAQAVGGLFIGAVTGGIVSDTFGQVPLVNEAIMLLIRFLYTFSTGMLILQIITGRGL